MTREPSEPRMSPTSQRSTQNIFLFILPTLYGIFVTQTSTVCGSWQEASFWTQSFIVVTDFKLQISIAMATAAASAKPSIFLASLTTPGDKTSISYLMIEPTFMVILLSSRESDSVAEASPPPITAFCTWSRYFKDCCKGHIGISFRRSVHTYCQETPIVGWVLPSITVRSNGSSLPCSCSSCCSSP